MSLQLTRVDKWIIVITGFGQHEGEVSGLEILHDQIYSRIATRNVWVELRSWNDNFEDLAKTIRNHSGDDRDPEIVVIGFSAGGGMAVELCRQLRKKNYEVGRLYLCDPVVMWKRIITAPLSMYDFFSITIPNNVLNVETWRQTCNYPRGAQITLQDYTTTKWPKEHDHRYTDVPHEDIQYLPDFRKAVLSGVVPAVMQAGEVEMIDVRKSTDTD